VCLCENLSIEGDGSEIILVYFSIGLKEAEKFRIQV